MPVGMRIGGLEVTALDDGEGPYFWPRDRAFPDATPDDWAAADGADPDARAADGAWLLRFRCFALRTGTGRTVLVDAGIGPADAPAAGWAPVPGRLPAELAAAGIDRADVDVVVLTHVHTDHIGWAVTGEGERYFPNARYLLQRTEIEALRTANPTLYGRLVDPLGEALDPVDGQATPVGGVRVQHAPGHTPGHQVVLADAGGDLIALTGDLLVHRLQLVRPHLAYALEHDADTARRSRADLLDRIARRGGVLATAHLTDPFIRLGPATGGG